MRDTISGVYLEFGIANKVTEYNINAIISSQHKMCEPILLISIISQHMQCY